MSTVDIRQGLVGDEKQWRELSLAAGGGHPHDLWLSAEVLADDAETWG
jgi:hypothetical protein